MTTKNIVSEIVREFHDGGLTWGEVPGLLMDVINDDNVDDVIRELPDDLREWFVRWARQHYYEGATFIFLNEKDQMNPIPLRALEAIRAWMIRNPS